jgi:hypothetical protein
MGANTTRCCKLAVPTRVGWNNFGMEEVDISSRNCVQSLRNQWHLYTTASCDTSHIGSYSKGGCLLSSVIMFALKGVNENDAGCRRS